MNPTLLQLLGWMHRKLRQNGSETLKDFAIGRYLQLLYSC